MSAPVPFGFNWGWNRVGTGLGLGLGGLGTRGTRVWEYGLTINTSKINESIYPNLIEVVTFVIVLVNLNVKMLKQ